MISIYRARHRSIHSSSSSPNNSLVRANRASSEQLQDRSEMFSRELLRAHPECAENFPTIPRVNWENARSNFRGMIYALIYMAYLS